MILTGHRDTYFRFLKDVQPNDRLDLARTEGATQRYRVRERLIMDSRRDAVPPRRGGHELALVTCFPFDAIQAGGPLRYVVPAERME